MSRRLQDVEEPGATELAHRWLLDGILCGERVPGAPMRFDTLRAESGLGVSALREALVRLETEKFVVSERHRGFRVAPLTLAELQDVNATRLAIETQALTGAIAAGDTAWEGEIASTLHQLLRQPSHGSKAPGSDSAAVWERHHRAFHRALLAACPSPWLLRLSETIAPHYRRYRQYIWRMAGPDALEHVSLHVDDEHRALAAAVIDRDADAAVAMLGAHYQRNMETLVEICAKQPGILEDHSG